MGDEDEQERKLSKKSNAGVSNSKSMRSKADMLTLEEPEPPSAQYPINIHHDPKTHKGVINQIYIVLEDKKLLSIKKFKPALPASTSVCNGLNVDVDTLPEFKDQEIDDEALLS